MILPDTNVLLAVFRADHVHHRVARAALVEARQQGRPLLLPDAVVASFIRMATNPRVFDRPETTEATLDFVDAILEPPGELVFASLGVWERFADAVRGLSLRGNDVPDAVVAAFGLYHDATVVTLDAGFRRFPNLRWRHLLG